MEALKESITEMSQLFYKKMSEFEERQQKLPASSSPRQGNLAEDFAMFKTFILHALRTLQSQVELLAKQNDNLEMHTRRKILLLHGVPEDKKEDTVAVIVKLVSQTLKLGDFEAKDVSRCHRMGASPSLDRPRPILFKLRDTSVRSKIWSAKTNLKGSGITMSEFLTKARHDIFMSARSRFGVSKCWTRDGSVFVVDASGVRHRVSSPADLDKVEGLLGKAPAVGGSGALKVPTLVERSKRVPKPKK